MYIKDEHPMRSRIRYRSMRGMGIGPEIVSPQSCPVELQMSSPSPLGGMMTAMTDAPFLRQTMEPLEDYADFAVPPPALRRFSVQPVELGSEVANMAQPPSRPQAPPRQVYTAGETIQRMSQGLAGYGRAGSVQQSHAYRGGGTRRPAFTLVRGAPRPQRGTGSSRYVAPGLTLVEGSLPVQRPSFGTCIGCR